MTECMLVMCSQRSVKSVLARPHWHRRPRDCRHMVHSHAQRPSQRCLLSLSKRLLSFLLKMLTPLGHQSCLSQATSSHSTSRSSVQHQARRSDCTLTSPANTFRTGRQIACSASSKPRSCPASHRRDCSDVLWMVSFSIAPGLQKKGGGLSEAQMAD